MFDNKIKTQLSFSIQESSAEAACHAAFLFFFYFVCVCLKSLCYRGGEVQGRPVQYPSGDDASSVLHVCSGFKWITAHYPQLHFRISWEIERKPDMVVC